MYYINRNIKILIIISIIIIIIQALLLMCAMCLHVLTNTCVFFDTKLIILL